VNVKDSNGLFLETNFKKIIGKMWFAPYFRFLTTVPPFKNVIFSSKFPQDLWSGSPVQLSTSLLSVRSSALFNNCQYQYKLTSIIPVYTSISLLNKILKSSRSVIISVYWFWWWFNFPVLKIFEWNVTNSAISMSNIVYSWSYFSPSIIKPFVCNLLSSPLGNNNSPNIYFTR